MKYYSDPSLETTKKGAALIKTEDTNSTHFYPRGLGLKKEVQHILNKDYYSNLVTYLRAHGHQLHKDDLTIYLAKEFGFCYGVERAVDYAYQTREKFPKRRILLTGEIIHNPHVNNRLIDMGIQFLSGKYSNGITTDSLNSKDVVILPAFGVSVEEFQALKQRGCILVDTTCGSVLNVWKRVEYYAKNGYTSIIHGKYYHEETIATSSQALKHTNGKYLVVRDIADTQKVCDFISTGGNKKSFMQHFKKAASSNFNPDRDLTKIGIANQTTMLSSESMTIAEQFKKTMINKFGGQNLNENFLTFDTICSATQERQDAVVEMMNNHKLDFMIVIGGYNSSNTNHLAEIASQFTTTYHIDDPSCILDKDKIKHKKIDSEGIILTSGWLPDGKLEIGITAGASTPNNKIGEAIEKIMAFRAVNLKELISS